MAGPRSSQALSTFVPPVRGLIRTKPSHEIAKDELYDGLNVVVRDGVLRPRPGLRRVGNSLIDPTTGTPSGSTAFETVQGLPWLVVGTTTGIYASRGVNFEKKTANVLANDTAPAFNGTLTGSLEKPSRFAILEFGTPEKVWLVHTNGIDPLLQWDGESTSFVPCKGNGAFVQVANLSVDIAATPAQGSIEIFLESIVATPEQAQQMLRSSQIVLRIDSEIFLVTASDPVAVKATATRAFRGTTAAAHVKGAVVYWERQREAPRFTDIATIGDHIVGLLPPYGLGWGNIRTLDEWPDLNRKNVAETPDRVVTIVNQGPFGGVLYKRGSLWRVRFVGGTSEATAFSVDFAGEYTGPAGSAAVVNLDGVHLYMTRTGRVGLFDGSSHRWYCDGVWPSLKRIIDPQYAGRIFGVYDPNQHEVTFYYPRRATIRGVFVDDGGLPRGVLHIALPKETGPYAQGAFLGHLATLWGGAVTTGTRYQLGDGADRVGIWGSDTAKTLYNLGSLETADECSPDGIPVGEARDNGFPFDFFWQTGLEKALDDPSRLDGVAHYFERQANYGAINFRPVRSYQLGRPAGERGEDVPVNLEEYPVKPIIGCDMRGLWYGLHYEFVPVAGDPAPFVRWYGATTYGHGVE